MSERAFAFFRVNTRAVKARTRGLTEIRGPYCSVMGPRYLEDLLELDVNVQLECLRSGLWGTKSTWGRIATYQDELPANPR